MPCWAHVVLLQCQQPWCLWWHSLTWHCWLPSMLVFFRRRCHQTTQLCAHTQWLAGAETHRLIHIHCLFVPFLFALMSSGHPVSAVHCPACAYGLILLIAICQTFQVCFTSWFYLERIRARRRFRCWCLSALFFSFAKSICDMKQV